MMNDSSKFAEFTEKAKDKIELIKLSLLRHEKNPKDREFLNDIVKSLRSVKAAALPVGLGRISELCFHLENLLNLIRLDKVVLQEDTLQIITTGKDRLTKLVREVETSQKERTTIKDILKTIQQYEEQSPDGGILEPPPDLEVLEEKPKAKPRIKKAPDQSLIPDEIKNEEYDKELFQIFVDQMQENISLLRGLTDRFPATTGKSKIISLCSDLVGRLQTSANYMGYERLADFYLQWIAELEMTDVDLSMGAPISFEFMDHNLARIAGLFPQIQDISAEAPEVDKIIREAASASPAPAPTKPVEDQQSYESDSFFKDLFSDMEIDDQFFDEDAEPVSALSGLEPAPPVSREHPAKTTTARTKPTKIKPPKPPVELDASFLEEERRSPEFDEELSQIFVQQLQENLSQLRTLADGYRQAPDKARVVDLCSNLVGRLQSSANYMGYEPLAEYYLQWIAELEMAGVELSLGNELSFRFMDEKIKKIIEIFPDVKDVPSDIPILEMLGSQPLPATVEKEEPQQSYQDLFKAVDEGVEDLLDLGTEPIASLSTDEEPAGEPATVEEEAPASEIEEEFIAPSEEEFGQPVPQPAIEPEEEKEKEEFQFGEFEEGEEGGEEPFEFAAEPIAALSGEVEEEDLLAPGPETGLEEAGMTQADEDIDALFHDDIPAAEEEALPSPPEVSAADTTEAGEEEDLFRPFDVTEEEFEVESASLEALGGFDTSLEEEPSELISPESEPGKGEEPEDLEALFGEAEEEPGFEEEEKPVAADMEESPVHQELFAKLSDALESLEQEPSEALPEEEESGVFPSAEPKGPVQPSDTEEEERKLYEKLFGALDVTGEDDDRSAAKPIDQVVEEILASEAEAPFAAQAARQDVYNAEEIRQNLVPDPLIIDDLMNKIADLATSRATLNRLYTDMNSLHLRLQEKDGIPSRELKPLQDLMIRLDDTGTALGRVSGEIKADILKVRMVPAGRLFMLYRDLLSTLAQMAGKEINFEFSGEDEAIEHAMIGDISDGLIHLLRNSIEHGIESDDKRRELGKNVPATITTRAEQAGSYLVLEVEDDGCGIDPARMKAVALARNLFSGDELYKMSDSDLTHLVMMPGVTTLPEATAEDRGKGMNFVKNTVEQLHGTIEIKSAVGRGTRIRLRIPQALPVFQALKFKVGTEHFALPVNSVQEILRLKRSAIRLGEDDAEVFDFHDHTIPLLRFAVLAGIEVPESKADPLQVIIVSSDDTLAGLIVDSITGLEDVAIKPLAGFVREASGFAAAAIKGADDISFIPDIQSLINKAVPEPHIE